MPYTDLLLIVTLYSEQILFFYKFPNIISEKTFSA